MPSGNRERFIEVASGYAATLDESGGEAEAVEADAEIPPQYMTEDLWKISQMLEPYGQENGELRFSIRRAQLYEIYPNRGDSRVFRFAVKFGRNIWPALWWTPHNKEDFTKGSFVNIVFTPDVNYWKGQSKMQMVIDEMEMA